MFQKNKFKLIVASGVFSITYDLTKTFSQSVPFSLGYSIVSAVVLGFLIGGIFDYKSNKRREVRELNQNIKELKNSTFYNNEDVISKLERIDKLRKDNSISEEEYLKLKKQLLNQ
jgi:hypothetical protein